VLRIGRETAHQTRPRDRVPSERFLMALLDAGTTTERSAMLRVAADNPLEAVTGRPFHAAVVVEALVLWKGERSPHRD